MTVGLIVMPVSTLFSPIWTGLFFVCLGLIFLPEMRSWVKSLSPQRRNFILAFAIAAIGGTFMATAEAAVILNPCSHFTEGSWAWYLNLCFLAP